MIEYLCLQQSTGINCCITKLQTDSPKNFRSLNAECFCMGKALFVQIGNITLLRRHLIGASLAEC